MPGLRFKLRKRVIVIVALFIFALSAYLFMRGKYVAPIIMYHSVSLEGNPKVNCLAVSPQAFEKQMRFLKQHKYNVLPLEELIGLVRNKAKLPRKLIAITFDDGYKDNFTNAFPILKKYNIPATIFIIIQEVGRPDRLSWEEIRQMQASGLITFGSHCLGPEPLVNISSDEEIKRQLVESKNILEEKLGYKVNMFCYPEGKFNEKIKQFVKDAGYELAAATSPGRKYANDDVFIIKRLRISENAANLFVFWFETTGFYTFFKENHRK